MFSEMSIYSVLKEGFGCTMRLLISIPFIVIGLFIFKGILNIAIELCRMLVDLI